MDPEFNPTNRVQLGPRAIFTAARAPPTTGVETPHSHRTDRGVMSIKSDRWIRTMAKEHGMIDPFVEGQVREVDAAGRRVISYGVSSYGYDMRVAREFKIFTNALSVIVDPKAFDEKSLVEFEGDVCVVPPNSFALARSVEYFRIPRNTLTI